MLFRSRSEAEATLEEVFRATAETAAPAFLVAATAPPSFDRLLATTLEP